MAQGLEDRCKTHIVLQRRRHPWQKLQARFSVCRESEVTRRSRHTSNTNIWSCLRECDPGSLERENARASSLLNVESRGRRRLCACRSITIRASVTIATRKLTSRNEHRVETSGAHDTPEPLREQTPVWEKRLEKKKERKWKLEGKSRRRETKKEQQIKEGEMKQSAK